ncbi:MAG: hypothetical protein Q9182_003434 [Xanthomendoza sp. 2 TL-2023]
MSQQPPYPIPKRRDSIQRPARARLTKKPSALSLSSPSSTKLLSTPTTATSSKFSLSTDSPTSPKTFTPTDRTNKNTSNSNRRSIHSLRSLVPKKSSHSLNIKVQNNIRDPSPSPSISTPAPPRQLLRLSDILDPEQLIRENHSLASTPTPITPNNPDGGFPSLQPSTTAEETVIGPGESTRKLIIHSPSGTGLDVEAFAKRPDRPLTLGERQAKIREEIKRREEEARRMGLQRAMRQESRGRCCCSVM